MVVSALWLVGWLVVFGDSWVKQPNFMVELIMLQHSDYNRFSRSILKIIEGWWINDIINKSPFRIVNIPQNIM